MKKKNVQRALALALAATMLAGTVAGCGKSSDSDSTQGGKSSNGKYAKELTIDVFDSQANFQGEQTGWFAKLIKDKFNIKIEHYCTKRGRWWRYFISDTFCKR